MKRKTRFNLLAALLLMLATFASLSTGLNGGSSLTRRALAQGPGPQGTSLGTGFTYQGRLTDTSGTPTPGSCNLRFTLYESTTGADQVGAPQTMSGVALSDGYFSVALDFGATAFTGEGRFLKIEVDCGGGYTPLSPRVELTPAPYTFHAVSTGALHGRPVSDNAPANGEVLKWDGSSWMPSTSGAGSAWSLTGNSGTTPGTNFVGTSDDQALELHVNGARALRLEPHAASPNVIGGYSGNQVTAGKHGATIGGGGESGWINRVTGDYGTVGGGWGNTASGDSATVGGGGDNTADYYAIIGGGARNVASGHYATVGGGESNKAITGTHTTVGGGYGNTASGHYATIGGGSGNNASGYATVGGGGGNTASGDATIGGGWGNTASGSFGTVPGGMEAHASLYGQLAYAGGKFASAGDAQTSLYMLRSEINTHTTWKDLYLDGDSELLKIASGHTVAFDMLIVGSSDAGETAAFNVIGVIENIGGATTLIFSSVTDLGYEDGVWYPQVLADDTNDALLIQVIGNGENIRWVATVRTAEVAW